MSARWPQWLSSPKDRYRAGLVLAMAVVVYVVVSAAWAALVPFFFGAIAAYILLPAVGFLDAHAPRVLQRWGLSRPLAILVVYLVCIGCVAGLLTVFIPTIIEQASLLVAAAPGLLSRLEGLLSHDLVEMLERVPPEIQQTVDANIQKAAGAVLDALQVGVGVTLRTLFQTVSFVFGMVIVPFWLFYVMKDIDRVREGFYALVPEVARDDVRCILAVIDQVLSAYVRGQVFLCFLVGCMSIIVLLIFGIREALLLGTLAGILEVVPYIGPVLGAVIPVVIALGDSPLRAVWVAVAFVAIQQVENIFLVPRISGHAVRFHPAAVMVIVVIGSEIAGIWGLLLAIPLTATVRDIFRYLYLRTTERGATPDMALETWRVTSM